MGLLFDLRHIRIHRHTVPKSWKIESKNKLIEQKMKNKKKNTHKHKFVQSRGEETTTKKNLFTFKHSQINYLSLKCIHVQKRGSNRNKGRNTT